MDPDTFYFYFYNMNFNTHALEKMSAYFYMAHPYDCTSDDPPPLFFPAHPPFYFMTSP
jgi:hypothetical protein